MRSPKTKPHAKHVPMRTCIGTQTVHPKRDMVRLVRTGDGHIVVDETGKKGGSRGVYLSKSLTAAQMAVRNKRLEAQFEQPILEEDIEAILKYFSQFEKRQPEAGRIESDG